METQTLHPSPFQHNTETHVKISEINEIKIWLCTVLMTLIQIQYLTSKLKTFMLEKIKQNPIPSYIWYIIQSCTQNTSECNDTLAYYFHYKTHNHIPLKENIEHEYASSNKLHVYTEIIKSKYISCDVSCNTIQYSKTLLA